MSELAEVVLSVTVPVVVEEPRDIEVSCGETSVRVTRRRDNDNRWAIWKVASRGSLHSEGYATVTKATAAARAYVRRVEHERLLHEAVREFTAGEYQ